MATKPRSDKLSQRPAFKLGDRVSVRPRFYDAIGAIVEDRGSNGPWGRRLWTVKVELDPPNVIYIELPEAEIKAVQSGVLDCGRRRRRHNVLMPE